MTDAGHSPASTSGLRGAALFSRYAYPPNFLGYCGPPDSDAVFALASGSGHQHPAAMAARFDGAWMFLCLIADCNGISDPLDERVVEAYWVGNPLLEQVPPPRLAECVRRAGVVGAGAGAVSAATGGGLAHHSFQVFAVYPWFGLLHSRHAQVPLMVLDRCRIRWGTVEHIDGDSAVVTSRRLALREDRLVIGDESSETVRCARGGVALAESLQVGDVVSLHWDWICDRLSQAPLASLRSVTEHNLQVVNASASASASEQAGIGYDG